MSLNGSSSEPMALSIMASTLFWLISSSCFAFLMPFSRLAGDLDVGFHFDGFVAGVAAGAACVCGAVAGSVRYWRPRGLIGGSACEVAVWRSEGTEALCSEQRRLKLLRGAMAVMTSL